MEKDNKMEMDKKMPPILQKLTDLDVNISSKCYLSATKTSKFGYLRPQLKFLEISCHAVPVFGICVIMLWFATEDATKAFFMNFLIALLIDIIIVAVVKASARRKRPTINNMDMFMTISVDKMSFPSGHVTRAVLLMHIFTYKFALPYLISLSFFLWCLSVCVSRVLLGRHHIGDVLAGVVIGIVEYHFIAMIWLEDSYAMGLYNLFSTHDEL